MLRREIFNFSYEGKISPVGIRRGGANNIRNIGIVDVDCIHLTQDSNYWKVIAIVVPDLAIL
jgi:hypothetical protein